MRIPTSETCTMHPSEPLELETETGSYHCARGCVVEIGDAGKAEPAPAIEPEESKTRTPEPEPAPEVQASPAIVEASATGEPSAPGCEYGPDVAGLLGSSAPLVAESLPATPVEFSAKAAAIRFDGPTAEVLEALHKAQLSARTANGELLLVVRLPEQAAITLLADAEEAKRTPADYFQRAVLFGCEAGWFRGNY